MNILTSETAQTIYGAILASVLIGVIIYTTIQDWKHYNKGYTYYENTFCQEDNEFSSWRVA